MLEDTHYTEHMMAYDFGFEVLKTVKALTNVHTGNRKKRGPMSDDRAHSTVYHLERPLQVFPERLFPEPVNKLMGVSVGTDFVAGCRDVAHQIRMMFSHMSEHEESGFDVGSLEQAQQPLRTDANAGLKPPPVSRGDLQT